MTAETLYQNQDILIDYVFGHCSIEMQDQIKQIIKQDELLHRIVEDMSIAIIRHDLDYTSFLKRIRSMRKKLIVVCNASGK